MRKVKDLKGLISELRPLLREYLEGTNTTFSGDKFQCPNRDNHSNNDDTPSCSFYSEETWHCFACQESGDVFTAAALLEGKPKDGPDWITDTVEYLANKLGVEYETTELSEAERLQYQTYEVLQFTASAAHQGYKKSSQAKEYAKARGWDTTISEQFQLGYCDYDKLYQALSKRGYTHEVLVRAGLVNKNLLHKRLLFPIRDPRGRTIGFASRTLLSAEEAKTKKVSKYLNSDSSAVYKKSETLYGLDQITGDTVWVVEGYADVVTLWSKGIRNIVGLGGVAFTEDHIQALLRKEIKTLILCLDNDDEGRRSEERILGQITRRHGLNVLVKVRDECKDPDSCLQSHDYLTRSGSTTLFDHYLSRYEKSSLKSDRDKALKSILLEKSPIDRERLCKALAKALDVRVDVILQEVDYLIDKEGDAALVNIMDLVKEKRKFEEELSDFERKAWQRGKLLGLSTKHPIFTEEMDGIQNMFYIVAGEEGTGKSALIRSLMLGVLETNPDKAFVLYFSIDDGIPKVISRLLASETGLEINAMENPRWRIEKNVAMSEDERKRLLAKRQKAFEKLTQLTSAFVIKDESTIKNTVDMERAIRTFKELAGDRQLVVFIDSLHRVRKAQKFHESAREQAMEVSDTLKRWCTVYDIPVIATAELRKLNTGTNTSSRRPTMDDIKEASDFKFDAECVMLLYNDMKSNARNQSAAKLKWEWTPGTGEWFPVVELYVGKNKTSSFSQKCLYFKFIPQCARMTEATKNEQIKYRQDAMSNG